MLSNFITLTVCVCVFFFLNVECWKWWMNIIRQFIMSECLTVVLVLPESAHGIVVLKASFWLMNAELFPKIEFNGVIFICWKMVSFWFNEYFEYIFIKLNFNMNYWIFIQFIAHLIWTECELDLSYNCWQFSKYTWITFV